MRFDKAGRLRCFPGGSDRSATGSVQRIVSWMLGNISLSRRTYYAKLVGALKVGSLWSAEALRLLFVDECVMVVFHVLVLAGECRTTNHSDCTQTSTPHGQRSPDAIPEPYSLLGRSSSRFRR
jgi:hypothetical protein